VSKFAYSLTDGQDPMTYAEIDYLAELARALPPQPVIVNIGAADGLSTVTFLEARRDALVFSCDVEPCQAEIDNVRAAGLDWTRVIRLLGRSQDTGMTFPYQCDLLFIDGGHTYDAVKGDILAWVPHVKDGCVFAFHDYIPGEKPANNPSEVDSAVDELVLGRYVEVGRVDRIIAFRRDEHNDRQAAWFEMALEAA
jgi:predicted O-methyltransferase YrrM